MLVARVEVVEKQVKPRQAAIDVRSGEIHRVIMVKQGAQGLARIADAAVAVQAGIDVRIEMVLELPRRCQGRSGLSRAVVIAGEAVALRRRMQVVQMRADLGRAEPDVILRQHVVDAADERVTVAREDCGTRGGCARGIAFVTPDALRGIRRIEHPIGILLGRHLVEFRRRSAKLTETLVQRSPGLAAGGVRGLGAKRG